VRLQEIAFEIRDLEEARRRLPDRLAALEQAFQQQIADIGAARLKHESLVQLRQRLILERDDLQERLRQAQQHKLMQVHNQREYSAVLNEIDSYKNGLGSTEEKILECDIQIEELSGPALEADERIAAERRRVEESKAALSAEQLRADQRLVELNQQRDELAAHLPKDMLHRFESVFRTRGGVALARVEKESCGACHVRLRPQVINQARRGVELVACDSCRRILIVDEVEPSEGAPTGGASTSGAETPDGSHAEAGH
jgi:hypothetical protein